VVGEGRESKDKRSSYFVGGKRGKAVVKSTETGVLTSYNTGEVLLNEGGEGGGAVAAPAIWGQIISFYSGGPGGEAAKVIK